MNPQGKGKIEWTDFTLNIVTGCEFGCDYGPDGCYANRLAQRIYPEKFKPTFREKGLRDKDLGRVPAGTKIFLNNMGDLFGPWVPDAWIEAHQDLVERYPQYIFQFLTKNPERYVDFAFPENCWLGATWDGLPRTLDHVETMIGLDGPNVKYISFEPLLRQYDGSLYDIDWIIIGEITENPKHESHKHVKEWAERIITQARLNDTAVFVKNQLGQTYKQREWPR